MAVVARKSGSALLVRAAICHFSYLMSEECSRKTQKKGVKKGERGLKQDSLDEKLNGPAFNILRLLQEEELYFTT